MSKSNYKTVLSEWTKIIPGIQAANPGDHGVTIFTEKHKITSRLCMPGMTSPKNYSGTCTTQDVHKLVPDAYNADVCICTTDDCNFAPFSTQASFFGVFLSILLVLTVAY